MKIEQPIITSKLDDDWYKLLMAGVIFHFFPRAKARFKFINRGKTQFPEGFGEALQSQVEMMTHLMLTKKEVAWLKTIHYIRPTWVEWYAGHRLDASGMTIVQKGGDLEVGYEGDWYSYIFWEVKMMATICELYYRMMGQKPKDGWIEKIIKKGKNLSTHECWWIDFCTRRRACYEVQDKVVQIHKDMKGFLGTSNPHFAMKYGIKPHGTYAHECISAMSALYGVRMADSMWMKHWSDYYVGDVGVALTDTFTTDVFLRSFNSYFARLFDGGRQDSGDPFKWGYKMLDHYNKLGIATSNKRMVFSNALTDEAYIPIAAKFQPVAQPSAGIGTYLGNDVGWLPLNIVIKLVAANFGLGWINVAKLSDDVGKYTGTPEAIELALQESRIA